ncbi:uncharacterized protein B0I36DRAFT_382595 [Microdochium trichocladiopsis]|uniref:Uncharacterized protein n=1 Tax=Microdochium trichocladiopsis TaxID=1682393 RepID=A0A9P9BTI4_9PEZI|nr:uncharacterized protein B0I36DRAFT_382595 [Microdochium trichocladiopsis]KAH7036000.1 hypothetical protein B0I36DRAFT_382595 [Microdochium trichocladiopsis]
MKLSVAASVVLMGAAPLVQAFPASADRRDMALSDSEVISRDTSWLDSRGAALGSTDLNKVVSKLLGILQLVPNPPPPDDDDEEPSKRVSQHSKRLLDIDLDSLANKATVAAGLTAPPPGPDSPSRRGEGNDLAA